MKAISLLTLLFFIPLAASCQEDQPAPKTLAGVNVSAASQKSTPSITWLSVVNVNDDDVLNLRQEPSAKSELVFEIPYDSANLIKIGESGRWANVQFRGYVGWVHSNYVEESKYVDTARLVGGELFCLGTEPHWNLKTMGDRANFRFLGDEVSLLNNDIAREGMNQNTHWLLHFSAISSPLYRYEAIIEKRECDDGMSDNTYPYTINVIGKTPPRLLGGCCRVK